HRIPILLHEQGLDDIVVDKLRLEVPPTELPAWRQVVSAKSNPGGQVDIAMVGKYVQIRDSYMSLHEALMHGGLKSRTRVNIHYIESTDLEQRGSHLLKGLDAILVPGGFGERGIEGKIQAVRYAREHDVPYLGICLGMQVAIVEYARHVLGFADANSTEFNRATAHPVIALISEWNDQMRGSPPRATAMRCSPASFAPHARSARRSCPRRPAPEGASSALCALRRLRAYLAPCSSRDTRSGTGGPFSSSPAPASSRAPRSRRRSPAA